MSTKQLFSALVIVVLLVAIAAAVWYVRVSPPDPSENNGRVYGDETEDTTVINHEFTGVLHTYSGLVMLPAPCHELVAEAEILESFPEQIRIILSTAEPERGVVCAQVVSKKPFSIEVPASEGAMLINVLLDGASVPFEILGGEEI